MDENLFIRKSVRLRLARARLTLSWTKSWQGAYNESHKERKVGWRDTVRKSMKSQNSTRLHPQPKNTAQKNPEHVVDIHYPQLTWGAFSAGLRPLRRLRVDRGAMATKHQQISCDVIHCRFPASPSCENQKSQSSVRDPILIVPIKTNEITSKCE